MKQKNIGEFISELRKEKKLTQDKLGEKIGVSGKTISKWECGINIPDFSNLEALATYFNITVFELLNGEKNDYKKLSKNKINNSTINCFKSYLAIIKNKYIKIFSLLIVLVVFLLITVFFLNDFNKNKIYSIYSNNEDYSISGYFIFNQEQNLIIINDIIYQGKYAGTEDEPLVTYLKITLYVEDKAIISYQADENNTYNSNINTLSNVLSSISFSTMETKEFNNYIITNEKKLKDAYLKIESTNNNEKNENIKIDLKIDKVFSNNKLFY